jgi:gamma-glutamyltranspeptidase/glutathione hydrolase
MTADDRRSIKAPGPARRGVLALGVGGLAVAGLATAARAQSGAKAPDAPQTAPRDVAAHRVEVPGPHGVVAAGHPLAAQAGLMMLMAGGSAADAAVAAMAVLNVVEPWASSAAGNGYATVYEGATGAVRNLSFGGAAPLALDPKTITPEDLDWGPKAAVTPGAFGGWIALASRYGRLSLKQILAPAIGYARDGHALDPTIAATIARQAAKLAETPTTAALFLPDGRPPAPRAIFRNENLARTFDTLVAAEQQALAGGADRATALQAAYDCFYNGPIAAEFVRFYRQAGGLIRQADLSAYRPRWTDPVSTDYRGYRVYSSPPASRGGMEICLQLNLLEGFEITRYPRGSAASLHLMAESIKVAKADVYPYVADPNSTYVPVAALLSKDYAATRRALIQPDRAIAFPGPGDLRPFDRRAPRPPAPPKPTADDAARASDTTSLSVVDRDGNAVAVTPTLGGGFGTGVVAGDTGLLFNNGMRMGSTSPYVDTVNHVAPGRVPLLNNSPTVVTRGGRFHLCLGSPGGETIGQTQFQTLAHLLDYEMPLQEAIEAPRFSLDAAPTFYRPGAEITLSAESRFAPGAIAALQALGHRVRLAGPYAIGSIQGVRMAASGAWTAGADPRRMAAAVGW